MIRFVDSGALEKRFWALCGGSAFGCKLAGVARAYGFGQGFARFWCGEAAAYGLLDGELTVCGRLADQDEARSFVGALGPGAVLCPAGMAGALGLEAAGRGAVLRKRTPDGPGGGGYNPYQHDKKMLGEVHGLLAAWGMAGAFEPFYLDLSHRLRHGGALLAVRREGERLVGCAVVTAVTEGEALLSAVAVAEDRRGRGIGRGMVEEVEGRLPGRRVYVLRREGENERFYRGMGYEEVGGWETGR